MTSLFETPFKESSDPALINLLRDLITFIGDNPDRPGLERTPERVLKAWKEDWGAGYKEDPGSFLTEFDIEYPHDAMIVFRRISFTSHCAHHLAPFFGHVGLGYLPHENRIVGLSKMIRVVRAFSRRLQVQERLTHQICECIFDNLKPDGCGVLIQAKHFCMMSRGVKESECEVTTCALRGEFRTDPAVKEEFMRHVRI